MADTTSRRPIVVGIDRSGHSEKALDWAVSGATARFRPLHVIHAVETTVTVWSPMMALPAGSRRSGLGARRGPAAGRRDGTGPGSHHCAHRRPGRGRLGDRLEGRPTHSSSGPVATASSPTSCWDRPHSRSPDTANCPVVVVRGSAPPTTTAPTVVAGFDGSDLWMDALGYAFARSRAARPTARRGHILGAGPAVDVPQPGRRRGDSRGGGGSPEGDRRFGRLPVAQEAPLRRGPHPRHDRPCCCLAGTLVASRRPVADAKRRHGLKRNHG
jgi:hypothetical protein